MLGGVGFTRKTLTNSSLFVRRVRRHKRTKLSFFPVVRIEIRNKTRGMSSFFSYRHSLLDTLLRCVFKNLPTGPPKNDCNFVSAKPSFFALGFARLDRSRTRSISTHTNAFCARSVADMNSSDSYNMEMAFGPGGLSGAGGGNGGPGSGHQRTKRMRTSFKHHQLRTMKSYFNINQNPDAKDLKQLAQKTGLSKRVLQVTAAARPPLVAACIIDVCMRVYG